MTSPFEDHLELRLVGYVAHARHGFALPLFGQHDRANTLYVAESTPSGDHRGLISRFDIHEPEAHSWLPVERAELVRIGDPWLDVFLWNEDVYVGSAPALWAELAPIRAELQELAPLSLLDAALNADAPERNALATAAMSYVVDRFDAARAARWREGTLRRQINVMVRRIVPSFHETLGVAEHALSTDAQAAHLSLPDPLLDRLRGEFALGPLIDDMRRLAGSLGLKFDLSVNPPSAIPKPVSAPDRPPLPAAVSKRDARPVLILAIGPRAREIARHIEEPGWLPLDVRSEELLDGEPTRGREATRVVQVISGDDPRAMEKVAVAYEVVVALVDDLIVADQLPDHQRRLMNRTLSLGAVRILAPALPEAHPAMSLNGRVASPFLAEWQLHALLDTAQARSPFWWGNPKRSLDRRIADIIAGAACLCLSTSISDQVLATSDGDPSLLIFALDLERGRGAHDDPGWSAASESTWFKRGPLADLGEVRFQTRTKVRMRDGTGTKLAFLEARSTEDGFGRFAIATMNELVGVDGGWFGHERDPPRELTRALAFPRHTFACQLQTADKSLLLTAETPSLEVLVAADKAGWRVVRYTDRETVRTLVHAKNGVQRRNLPAEVALGSIAASDVNRRLATRGVDGRDIIRLSPDQLHEWLDQVPSDDRNRLRGEIRPLRTTQDPRAAETPPAFALRRRRLTEGRFDDDPTIRALGAILKIDPRALIEHRPYKRAADLDACWTPPIDGFMRFALADGVLPPQIAPLRPKEIVLQTFFVLDGDWSTPALFRSRVFGTWATATLSRSSSWMSRFSVGATFAGFPVPPPFRIVGTNGTGCALESADDELLTLAREVEGHIERIANAGSSWKGAQHSEQLRELPAAVRLEALILAAYELPPDADDLSILQRLVAMNGRLSGS